MPPPLRLSSPVIPLKTAAAQQGARRQQEGSEGWMKGGRNADSQVGEEDVPSILASVVQTRNDLSSAAATCPLAGRPVLLFVQSTPALLEFHTHKKLSVFQLNNDHVMHQKIHSQPHLRKWL